MGWFTRDRRGISWKDQTLDSISLPPLPLMVFFGLFIMLLYFASYSEFKEKVERSKMGLRFGLILLPLVAVLVANMIMLCRRWWLHHIGIQRHTSWVAEDGGSPVEYIYI
ncbi:hypothetical protein F511_18160 [Dorcoceras hygrometricum]|uniref:Uncharacterized protein n=1 Tax=Dorcoceras hygrometricum TaxID=472368 RepID=A0A2Z7BFD6_9LAMI|nr:hypothetical protein F511_18160 [Dorcoceras hygrometricum]